jgi:hypothetical protein
MLQGTAQTADPTVLPQGTAVFLTQDRAAAAGNDQSAPAAGIGYSFGLQLTEGLLSVFGKDGGDRAAGSFFHHGIGIHKLPSGQPG